MIEHAHRLRDLYESGGIGEVKRGIRDFVINEFPVHWFMDKNTLHINGHEIEFLIDTREDYWRSKGHGEFRLMHRFEREIEPGDVVWDVGANVGSYSILAAKAGAEVIAFEPSEPARMKFAKNSAHNDTLDDITLLASALSDTNGRMHLDGDGQSGKRTLTENGNTDTLVRRGDTVPTYPDVIKIDVEGHEVQALEGMPKALNHARWIMVEVHDDGDVSDVQSLLSDASARNEFLRITERQNEVYVFAYH